MNETERLLIAIRGALAALAQPALYPADVERARSVLRSALAVDAKPGREAR